MRSLYIILLSCFFTLPNFSQNTINFINETKDEITVNVLVYAKNEKVASVDAKLYAVNTLLFRGVSNSSYNRPMIGTNEEEIKNKHANYFDSFYNNRYMTFITSAIAKSKLAKDESKRKCMLFEITIQKHTLKMDLENNGVIRKFGF